jgi:hypothetical protein
MYSNILQNQAKKIIPFFLVIMHDKITCLMFINTIWPGIVYFYLQPRKPAILVADNLAAF